MKKEAICPRCGATNVGPQTKCLICQADLSAVGGQAGAAPAYRPVQPALPSARLILVGGSGGPPYVDLPLGGLTIGRSAGNGLVLATDSEVSRQHALVEYAGGEWVLSDLNSRNGTYVNGVPVTRQALHRGDQIQIGQTVWAFHS